MFYYDSKGKYYAYCEDEVTLFTFDGTPIAYFENDSIFNFEGKHIAFYEKGMIWDHSGKVMLFTEEAKFGDGPLKPKISLRPLKRLKSKLPMKKKRVLMPPKSLKSRKWSLTPLELAFLHAS